jgi:hypothetical protein
MFRFALKAVDLREQVSPLRLKNPSKPPDKRHFLAFLKNARKATRGAGQTRAGT